MITCERCGKPVPDTAAICPNCGTVSPLSRTTPTGGSGQNPPSSISYEYSQGYGQQAAYQQQQNPPSSYPPQSAYPPPSNYPPQPNYPPQAGYQPYMQQQMYQPTPMPAPVSVNVNVATNTTSQSSSGSGAVVVEVILSLFNIYGVGWLMAGETTTGVILLICSLVLYWPIVIGVSIATLGLGLFCLEPLSIGAIILNAILLNNKIKQKSTMIMVQTTTQIPPSYPRQ